MLYVPPIEILNVLEAGPRATRVSVQQGDSRMRGRNSRLQRGACLL